MGVVWQYTARNVCGLWTNTHTQCQVSGSGRHTAVAAHNNAYIPAGAAADSGITSVLG